MGSTATTYCILDSSRLVTAFGPTCCLHFVSPPGTIRKGQQVSICSSLEPEGKCRMGKVNELFVYDNFSRAAVEEVQAGDICALTGIADISVSGTGIGV